MNKITGSLVDVSLEIGESSDAGRFFLPRNIKDVAGSRSNPDIRYRYLEARAGQKYGVTVRLHDCSKRYQVSIAIDGRCILSGRKVPSVNSFITWPAGYIFFCDSENGGTIRGWREDQDTVREFVFTSPEQSFAGKWGDFSAMGTIVIAVFRESSEPDLPKIATRGLGTGYGDRIESQVRTEEFHSKDIAYEIFVLNYQSKDNLQRLGVWEPETETRTNNRIWPGKQSKNFCQFLD